MTQSERGPAEVRAEELMVDLAEAVAQLTVEEDRVESLREQAGEAVITIDDAYGTALQRVVDLEAALEAAAHDVVRERSYA